MESSLRENNLKSGCDIRLIFIVVILIIFVFIFFRSNRVENMSPGVVTQMYAQDAQDTYLKGNVDKLATGNFLLNWNQPTRLATGSYYYTTGPNRGALLKNLCYKCKKQKCECKDGPVYYPKGYPGDYFEFPTPDINYPLPYIVSNAGFVREGFNDDYVREGYNDDYVREGFSDNYVREDFSDNMAKLKLFYADWCGHCKQFKPIFDGELTNLIKSSNIPVKLEAVDCEKNKEMIKKYNISGFPTLILEVNNQTYKYENERKPRQIIEFIKQHLNGGNVREDFSDNSPKLKLFYADWCGHCKQFKPIFDGELTNLVKSSNIPVKLEAVDCVKNKEMAKKYNIAGYPTLILEVNNQTYEYEDKREPKQIIEFIKRHLNM
jgi:thiol-disulfide isomerase/thioredoxin